VQVYKCLGGSFMGRGGSSRGRGRPLLVWMLLRVWVVLLMWG